MCTDVNITQILGTEQVWSRLQDQSTTISNKQIVCDWESTIEERLKCLKDHKKNKTKAFSLQRYFNGLLCIRNPIGIDLVSYETVQL